MPPKPEILFRTRQTPESLVGVLVENKKDSIDFIEAQIPPESINVLTQPRTKLVDISNLAQSIADHGQLQDSAVGVFDRDHAIMYVQDLNDRWNTSHNLDDLKTIDVNGKPYYLIMIAGHRRMAALLTLKTNGCPEHQAELGLAPCHELHPRVGHGLLFTRIYVNPDYHARAVEIQEGENIRSEIPSHEIAISAKNLWVSRRITNPDYTIQNLARDISRSPETVRKMLKYADVDPVIQKLVEDGKLTYSHALELERLQREGVDRWELYRRVDRIWEDRLSVPALRQQINDYLKARKLAHVSENGEISEQLTMQDLMLATQLKEQKRASRFRDEFSVKLGYQFKGVDQYVTFVLHMLTLTDSYTPENSPFRHVENLRALISGARSQQELSIHLRELLGLGQYQQLSADLQETLQAAEKLLDTLGGEVGKNGKVNGHLTPALI